MFIEANDTNTMICRTRNLHPLQTEAFSKQLDAIEKALDWCESQEDPTKLVVFFHTANDSSETWFSSDEILIDDLCRYLMQAFLVIQRCVALQHRIVFYAESEVDGFCTELAFACSRFGVANKQLRIGFSEIEAGRFPFAGIFLQGSLDERWNKKDWEKNPFLEAEFGTNRVNPSFMSIKDFLKDCRDRPVYPLQNKRNVKEKPKITIFDLKPSSLQITDDAMIRMWAKFPVQSQELKLRRPWRMMWDLVRDKKTANSAAFLVKSMIFLNARHLLSRIYSRWLERRHTLLESSQVQLTEAPTVFVDLEFLVPPVRPLIRLMSSGCKVVLFSESIDRTKDALDLLGIRMERSVHRKKAESSWLRNLAWTQKEVHLSRVNGVISQWLPNDQVIFSYKDCQSRILRLSGNRDDSDCGWIESVEEDLPANKHDTHIELKKIYKQIAYGCIDVKPINDMAPSTLLRSIFLEELMYLSQRLRGGANTLLQSLRDTGWGFVAEENSWEYFLRTREESFTMDASSAHLQTIGVSPVSWQIGIWKEAREYGNQGREKREPANPFWISRHLAFFTSLLAHELHTMKVPEQSNLCNALVCESLGFPTRFGTPMYFTKKEGELRTHSAWKIFRSRYAKAKIR